MSNKKVIIKADIKYNVSKLAKIIVAVICAGWLLIWFSIHMGHYQNRVESSLEWAETCSERADKCSEDAEYYSRKAEAEEDPEQADYYSRKAETYSEWADEYSEDAEYYSEGRLEEIFDDEMSDFCFYGQFALYFFILACTLFGIKKYISNRCDLQLDSDGISGNRKKLFSNKNLKLPMEQIDSITMNENVFSRSAGTKTLEIRSGTGMVRFPWVHNADEFVEATLNEIKKFKETVNKNTVPTYAAPPTPAPKKSESDSAIEQLEKLKKLYDQGVLTAEEFEAKKKALLDKI